MTIDPIVLSSITSAVVVLGREYGKGLLSEAGKTTWHSVKGLLGWRSEPTLAEIPEKLANEIEARPEVASELFELLKENPAVPSYPIVGTLEISNGKVVIAQNIQTLNM